MISSTFYSYYDKKEKKKKLILIACSENSHIYVYPESHWTCSKEE